MQGFVSAYQPGQQLAGNDTFSYDQEHQQTEHSADLLISTTNTNGPIYEAIRVAERGVWLVPGHFEKVTRVPRSQENAFPPGTTAWPLGYCRVLNGGIF